MQFGLRVQDIIGLVLAVLIVAILISIILILRESARERRLWREEYEEEEPERQQVRGVRFPQKVREEEHPVAREEKPRVVRSKGVVEEEREKREEKVGPLPMEGVEEVETIPVSEVKKEEPKQVILERALRKLGDLGVDFGAMKPVFSEDVVHFSPLLWEVKEEVRSGKELGDIVIHTVFKSLPGYSPDEIVERYRSGDVSVVEKLEARVKTREGRDFLIATMNLVHFQVPELDRHFRQGNLKEEEYELLRALKFVDRATKKDFARMVYARIMDED